MFNGDWHLVLAAYNGGLGRVQRAMKRAGTDDFWTLSESSRYLPRKPASTSPDPGRHRRCEEPRAVRLQRQPGRPCRVRESPGSARHRSAPRRGVDGSDDRRGAGAQPGTAALDDTAGHLQLRDQGPGRRSRSLCQPARNRVGRRARVAQVAHRPAGRVAQLHRPQAAREPRRSGGSQQAVGPVR